jgi:predicted nucleic acid-binding protein
MKKNIYLSVITIGEIKFGIDKLDKNSKRKKELNLWFHSLLNKFSGRILEIDIETMIIWSNITNTLKKEGITISIMDALIASSSIRYRMNLVTRNVKDFKDIKNLKYINPFE